MSVALERLRLAGGRVPQGEVSEVALLLWLGHYEAALSCIGKDGMARRAVESLVKAMNSAQQASAVWFPSRAPRSLMPESARTFRASDGSALGCCVAGSSDAKVVVVHWGGNAELAARSLDGPWRRWVGSGLVRAVFVDYRGYGWSEGRPLVSRLWDDVRDLLVALPDLLCSTASQAVVFSGRSLGAHCALHAALTADVPARGLIMDAPVSCQWPMEGVSGDAWDAVAEHFERLNPGSRTLTCECCGPCSDTQQSRESLWMDPVDRIRAIDVPLLVLGGTEDVCCPRALVEEVFSASPSSSKNLVMLQGLGHNELRTSDKYWEALEHFLHSVSRAKRGRPEDTSDNASALSFEPDVRKSCCTV